MEDIKSLRSLKRRHSASLLRMPGVCGVDIEVDKSGRGRIVVHLKTGDPKVRSQLPDDLEGTRLRYTVTGPIQKLNTAYRKKLNM